MRKTSILNNSYLTDGGLIAFLISNFTLNNVPQETSGDFTKAKSMQLLFRRLRDYSHRVTL